MDQNQLPNATAVGPYKLVAPIGAGGMGEVWKARDTRLDRLVAIKFSHTGYSDRFQREAHAVAGLSHPNIATLFDVGPDYLVMEYVEGESLRAPGDTRKLLDLAVQIADGVAAAHSAGIVHRDLKPDNILLIKTGRIKILDFGLAKQTRARAANEGTMTATQPGTVMGTVAYMSPEQARGQELDASSDQFSLGLVLYELATGKRAFQRPSAAETMSAIIQDDAEPLPTMLPAPFRWAVERLLAKNPADRYDTTRGLYLELRTIRDRLTEATRALMAERPTPRHRLSRLLPALLGAAIAAALVGAVAWMLQPWRPDLSRYRFVPFATEDYPEYGAVWSPDGRAIADGEYRLMLKSIDGSAPGVLARHPYRPGGFIDLDSISWASDGSRLYYRLLAKPYSVARAGGAPQELAVPPGIITRVMAGPDSASFAVMQSRRERDRVRYRLGLAASAGGDISRVLFEPEASLDGISWAPDSPRLLVTE